MARYKQIKVPELAYGPVSIRFDTEWEEYQVRLKGCPGATYHTDCLKDAKSTAQAMRNNTTAWSDGFDKATTGATA